MILKRDFSILEFDPALQVKIESSDTIITQEKKYEFIKKENLQMVKIY